MIRLKRAYDPPARSDGYRVLVDRLWPRGVRKDEAALDAWPKELAPSDALRRWFGHDPDRFDEFRERYLRELDDDAARAALEEIAGRAAHGTVTLVYAAHDEEHNNAVVVAERLERRARPRKRSKTTTARRAPRRGRSVSPRGGRRTARTARAG